MYLIDSNIFGFLIKENLIVLRKFMITDSKLFLVSSIVWAEMMYGLTKLPQSKRYFSIKKFYDNIKKDSTFLPFDHEHSEVFAKLKINCQSSGQTIENFDLMIASQAIANNLILVTNNTKHFENIPNLKIEDWTKI